MNKNRSKTYDRVMSRVYNRSRTNLKSDSVVTRHQIPSSVRLGAKPSISNVSSSVFSELPTVLNDYVPESSRENDKKSKVVRPRRTIKSLDTAKSPPRILKKVRECQEVSKMKVPRSLPSVVSTKGEGWADSHVRQCYSSRSHTRLKELKVINSFYLFDGLFHASMKIQYSNVSSHHSYMGAYHHTLHF